MDQYAEALVAILGGADDLPDTYQVALDKALHELAAQPVG